jgi:hypothetical protein
MPPKATILKGFSRRNSPPPRPAARARHFYLFSGMPEGIPCYESRIKMHYYQLAPPH